jgi:hypothetical protein
VAAVAADSGGMIMKTLLALAFLAVTAASASAQVPASQRVFDSPETALAALVEACRADDSQALATIFGAKHADKIGTVDRARDRDNRAAFARAAQEYRVFRREQNGRVTMIVGFDAWPLPFPLVPEGSGWRFDTEAGIDELINRRVGANELAAIETLRAYVNAQRQYASVSRDEPGVRQFARKLQSAPGKKDGLYWSADAAKGEEISPIGPLLRDTSTRRAGDPYNGYYFKILTRQGQAAPAGRYDYVINGRMIAGFAMVAYPADYGKTGIKTFVVNHYGVVYEKDLGPSTAKVAPALGEYNPDTSWNAVEP